MKKLALVFLACICGITLTAQDYDLVILDNSASESGAYGINNYGFVCGYKMVNGGSRPYLWDSQKDYLELAQPAGAVSTTGIAYAIDDYFDVVGTYGNFGSLPYHISSGTGAAWILDANYNYGSYKVPDAPVCARDVNNSGDIAGYNSGGAYDFGYTYNIFDGTWYQANFGFTMFFSINDAGSVTGSSPGPNSMFCPVFVHKEMNGSRTVISGATLAGGIYLPSGGFKVNENNHVVGIANNQGFYWEPLTGSNVVFGAGTTCYSINNSNLVVGVTNSRACMWKPTTNGFSVVDLNKFVGDTNLVLETAFGVNDLGQIVGQALNKTTGVRSAFLLTPAKSVKCVISKDPQGFAVRWTSVDSHNYAIHTSDDLKNWITLPDIYVADGTNSWVIVPNDGEKLFLSVADLTP